MPAKAISYLMSKRKISGDKRKQKKKNNVLLPQSDAWLSAWEEMKPKEKTFYWDWVSGFENLCCLITDYRHPPHWTIEKQTQWWRHEMESVLKPSNSFKDARSKKMLPLLPGHLQFLEVFCSNLKRVPNSKTLDLIVRSGRLDFDIFTRRELIKKYVDLDCCRLVIYNEGSVSNEIKHMNTRVEEYKEAKIIVEVFTSECMKFFKPGEGEGDYAVVCAKDVPTLRKTKRIPDYQDFFPVTSEDRIVKLTGATDNCCIVGDRGKTIYKVVAESTQEQAITRLIRSRPYAKELVARVKTGIKNIVIRYSALVYQEKDRKRWKSLTKVHGLISKKRYANRTLDSKECLEALRKSHEELYEKIEAFFSTLPGSRQEAIDKQIFVDSFCKGVQKLCQSRQIANETLRYKILESDVTDQSEAETVYESDIGGKEEDFAFLERNEDACIDFMESDSSTEDEKQEEMYANTWARKFGMELRKKCNRARLALNSFERNAMINLTLKLESLAEQTEREESLNSRDRFWNRCCNEGMSFKLTELIKETPSYNMSLSDEIRSLRIWLKGNVV